MLNKLLNGMLLLVIAFSPYSALGQDMHYGKWWRNPKVSEQLNLSQEEKSGLDKQFLNSRRRLIDLKSKLEREQFELENLLESEALDEDAVKVQFKKLDNARSELAEERFNFLMNVRKILGNERFQEVKGMYKNMRKRKMHQSMER